MVASLLVVLPAALTGSSAQAVGVVHQAPSGSGFDARNVTDTFVAGGNWTRAVSADWLGNGRMVVLTQGGMVYEVTPSTGAQRVLLNLTAKVNDAGEAGSLDILVDPTGSGFWIYYTVQGSDRLRISHFTVGSSAERVVWTHPGLGYNTASPYHVGGALDLGPDGKLYLSIGDRAQGRSNDLTNVFGKVLRINTDGTVPAGNPFADGAGPNVDEIWAYGLRNPFRASFDRTTGQYWVGDVGGNVSRQAYEEVNIVEAGKNYGWPACEGPLSPPKNGPTCPAGVTGPVFSYGHDVDSGCCFNKAIVGGEIYRGSVFPLSGHYVYADYPSDTFSWLQLGSDGRTAVGSGLLKETTVSTPVWLGVGPDGYIYWLSLGWGGNGQLRRLGYNSAVDRPPTITTVTATPTSGSAPLSVTFTGVAGDPDGTPVTYAWDFGDGTGSSQANPSHAYTTTGTFAARLQVSSGGRTVSSDPIPISVGTAPTVAITGPADGTTFTAGRSFTLTGTGNDPDTGALSGSALAWDISFLHDDHSHPAATGTGAITTFTVPRTGHDFAGDTRYRVTLTATDPDGLKATTSIVLRPIKASVTVRSNQAPTMTVDNITQTVPHTIDTLMGFSHQVSVPASQCVAGRAWNFSSWSDGGARTHTFTASAGLDLLATYVDAGSPCGDTPTPPTTPTTPTGTPPTTPTGTPPTTPTTPTTPTSTPPTTPATAPLPVAPPPGVASTPLPPPPAAVTPTTTLLHGAHQINLGQVAELQVTGPPLSTVDLFAYSRPSTTYRLVRSGTLDGTGRALFAVRPGGDTRLYAQLRNGPVGNSVVIGVRYAVSFAGKPQPDGTVRFVGTVVPSRAGVPVAIYRGLADGTRQLVGRGTTSATGQYSIPVRFRSAGTMFFLATAGGTSANREGVATAIAVPVRG